MFKNDSRTVVVSTLAVLGLTACLGCNNSSEPPDGGATCKSLDGGMRSDGSADVRAGANSVVLYTNDFEHPNQPLAITCGNSLDPVGINTLYGTSTFVFAQVNTVEGVVIADNQARYKDPSGTGGKYALGMLSVAQDDKLALTFPTTGKPFLNVGLDLSSIDVNGCGGPFGTRAPAMRVSLYDTPTSTFNFGAPGTLLAEGTVTGPTAPDAWTFAWQYGVVSLDASKASQGHVTVLFDLTESGYAAFDNLSIVASLSAGVIDRNNNGTPDNEECGSANASARDAAASSD